MVERGGTKREATEMVEIAPTTFMHRIRGRPSAVKAAHRQQTMKIEEENMLVDRCYFLDKIGFPPAVWRVRELALEILQRRDPRATLGKKWVSEGLYHRHPEMRSVYSRHIEWLRTVRGNDSEIMTKFFDELAECVYSKEIKPKNTYNFDEIGFFDGLFRF
ncbi:uncharacterized protein LAJ45_07563 [Morchella importuna]|uniref:uncharacterized protein n=1 Tax=Morchella importuna TaxID=1174673 RepID=UPI001E8D11F1|nr:uncharacterized protein LAJ45_07563 [Morchella importuna]KAH8148460.1 hypothetical protein LAJ45_07563 [Morchella importuna]